MIISRPKSYVIWCKISLARVFPSSIMKARARARVCVCVSLVLVLSDTYSSTQYENVNGDKYFWLGVSLHQV